MRQPRRPNLSVLSAAVLSALSATTARAQELPVACGGGTCVAGPAAWVTSGHATATFTSNALNVQQTTDEVVLNWQSFNVSADGTVTFTQPSADAIALNRIFQADPSRIFGTLTANGRVFLLNQNGIVFGEGAIVNVGGLLASTLDMTPQAVENGIAGAINDPSAPHSPAFRAYANGRPSAPIVVESGASIATAEGGQVLVFAPTIEQRGSIATPGGQTLLAAGTTVYLAASSDENLRGLLVEVDAASVLESSVTNGAADGSALAGAVGQIVAERGNVTLAGLAVNQNGRVSATTSVRQNGSIRLQARTGAMLSGGVVTQRGALGGELTLGTASTTEVVLSGAAADTTVDANTQPRSLVSLVGADVEIAESSRVTAAGGDIVVKAQENQSSTTFERTADTGTPATADASRVYVAPGAVLDVAGAETGMSMDRNVLRVELRGNQLRDSPEQRDGPLRGQTVYVDIRRSGTRDDGTQWRGTPLADVNGDIATVARSVAERNLQGGSIVLQSQGDVIVAPGAVLDVSGGVTRYADGFLATTQLLAADGSVVDIGDAEPDRQYQRTVTGYTRIHERWGMTEIFPGFVGINPGTFERGYVEGADAGSVTLVSPHAIFDGDVTGTVATGRHQRDPTAALPADGRRPYNQLPRGAQFTLGRIKEGAPEFVAGAVQLAAASRVLPSLLNDDGLPFDPRSDALPEAFTGFTLRTELLGRHHIAEATLTSDESITLAADAAVTLPAGGALSLTAPSVVIDGTIAAAGGTVSVTAERSAAESSVDDRSSLVIGASARIDTSGRWINDDERTRPDRERPAALTVDGGNVTLRSTAGDLTLARGSRIDVSAGAHRSADGHLHAGHGGTITLETQPIPDVDRRIPTILELGAELRGYALADGGTLDITVGEICIAPSAAGGATTETLYLGPEFFATGGFASYNLRTNRDGLGVRGSAPVVLRQSNLVLPDDAAFRPSGGSPLDFGAIATLDEILRRPTNLSLRVGAPAPVPYTEDSFATAPKLELAPGTRIEADADATISLRANTRIAVDGTIVAPSGSVSMLLDDTLAVGSFIGAQTIRLGGSAAIDLRGVALIAPDARGARLGAVLDGGALSLTANRGYIVLAAGSALDVSGASGLLDLRRSVNDAAFAPVAIGSSAGTIALTAAEGVALFSDLAADAGSGSSIAGLRPRGGTLRVTLHPSLRNDPLAAASQPSMFPTGARMITLTQSVQPLVIGPDTPVPSALNGHARVAADSVTAGGFDALVLDARVLAGVNQIFQAFEVPGVIRVDGDVALRLPAELALNAARLDVAGGRAMLSAPYVALGNRDPNWFTELEPTIGVGSLTVNAGFIEITGRSVIDGAAATTLASVGDLRLRGLELPITVGSGLLGSLSTAGDLTLSAAQVYGTTLSDFSVAVRNDPAGTLTIASNGAVPKDVLSAASRLRLEAPSIVQAGTLRAPFGSIELAGESISLRDGSLTSTSAEGLTVPFGSTQGGFAWVYDLANLDNVYGADARPAPAQNVALDGRNIDIALGATIDLSGGGDLLAYEFVPGVGGSRDVLAAGVRPNEFAIVPSLDIEIAPFDAREYVGSPLRPGDNVVLEGGGPLPGGEYVLLPARYALLPGAFLVRAVDGYEDALTGEAFTRIDGSTVVAGYRKLGATDIAAGTRRSGFAVQSAALARREAAYTTTSGNEFFANEAAALERSAQRLPRDGGVLALGATESLRIDGTLRAGAALGGRGAAVDISSTLLRVAEGGGASTTPGEVVIDSASLSRLTAESLLLGGRRLIGSGATDIDVTADRVTIAAGTSLTAPELLVGARDTVLVEAGSSLAAAGSTATGAGADQQRFRLSGDGAFVRVSSDQQAKIEHSATSGARGTLEIESGATLSAGSGAILLDASRNTDLLGNIVLPGGSLNVGASSITLSASGVAASGLVLPTDDLARLGIDELVLTSGSTVNLSGAVTLGLNRLVIDAAGLRADASGERTSIDVRETVRLTNTAGSSPMPTAGTATLELRAASFELGGGAFALDGFSHSSLIGGGALTFEDGARLLTTGDLAWSGTYLTGAGGARGAFDVGRALTLGGTGAPTSAANALALGARLDLAARSIVHDSSILLPGGAVSLRARGAADPSLTNSVALGANALIDVRGQTRLFDRVAVAAPGGRVELSSDYGEVVIGAGSIVDVRGAVAGGAAGDVSLRAAGAVSLAGRLLGHADNAPGGSLAIDAESFGGFESAAAHAAMGGFTSAIRLRQRGAGDLVVAGDTLRARAVDLVAEQGSVRVASGIDASGDVGGRVRLVAADSVEIDGTIAANAGGEGQRGGVVELLAESGGVRLNAGSVVDVSGGGGAAGGTVLLRLERAGLVATLLDTDTANDLAAVAGTVNGARALTVEGYQAYDDADGVLSGTELVGDAANPWFADAEAFMASDAALRAALDFGADATRRIRPGIEIRSGGDLTLAADWNLFPWRFGGAPGALTLRAGGDLALNGSLSDGFAALTGTTGFQLSTTAPAESWSYRLVGGSSQGSADPLAVRGLFEALPGGAGSGDVRLSSGTATVPRMVRTGTGAIEIAAANDFSLGNQQSVVYTAGVSGPGIRFGTAANTLGSRAYPIDGGDISISAGGNIRGAATNQFVNAWLWRVGLPAILGPQSAVGWTVNFERFEQNVGALGGGDVRVRAGGDVTDFSVSLPSIGRQVGGTTLATSVVEVVGGGTLDVGAEGSILGGSYYVGRGSARLRAGDAIGSYSRPAGSTSLAPILGLGDSTVAATARTDLAIDAIVNPSLLPPGIAQLPLSGNRRPAYFASYSDSAAARLTSVAGDLLLEDRTLGLVNQLTSMAFLQGTDQLPLHIVPPTLTGAALSGDVELGGPWILFPAPKGNVELYAQSDVRVTDVRLALPDTPVSALPTVVAPSQFTIALSLLTRTPPTNLAPFLNAPVPVHADENQPDGVPDLTPARVVAATGDIEMRGVGQDSLFYFAKPARLVAGRDLIDVAVQAQHLRDSDITLLQAGRDLRYTAGRDSLGNLEQNLRGIAVDGPGLLQVVAGRDVDLQTSQGIVTRGNIDNRFLPAAGASVSVLAGVGDVASLDSSAAVFEYLVRRPRHSDDLVAFVRSVGGSAASIEQAAGEFLDLEDAQQRAFFASLGLALPAGQDYVALLDTYLTQRGGFAARLLEYVRQNGSGAASSATEAAVELMTFDEALRREFFASIGANAEAASDDFALLDTYVLAPARAARTLLRYVNTIDDEPLPAARTLDEARAVFRSELTPRQQRGFFVGLGVELGEQSDYAALLDEYVFAPNSYAAELSAYVRRFGGAADTNAAALAEFAALDASHQRAFLEPVLFSELREGGRTSVREGPANGDYGRAFRALEAVLPGSLPDTERGEPRTLAGDIRLFFSRLYTLAGGDINVLAPGGEINVGLAAPPTAFGVGKAASELGMVVQQTGSVSALAYDDFQVNESRVFAADGGDILVWSTEGDIDAGRGAKTAISAPPPRVTIDENGQTSVHFPAALTGSGIQTLASSRGVTPGDVDLYAPGGVINAGDAGIRCNNCTFGAQALIGADNVTVGGDLIAPTVDTGGLGASLTGVSAVASSASNAAEDTVGPGREAEATETPLADQALGFLDVVITGFGDPGAPSGEDDEDDED